MDSTSCLYLEQNRLHFLQSSLNTAKTMPSHRSERCLQALGPLDAVKSIGPTHMHKSYTYPMPSWGEVGDEEEENIQIGLLGLWRNQFWNSSCFLGTTGFITFALSFLNSWRAPPVPTPTLSSRKHRVWLNLRQSPTRWVYPANTSLLAPFTCCCSSTWVNSSLQKQILPFGPHELANLGTKYKENDTRKD